MSIVSLTIRRALISVSNKEGLDDLVSFLHQHGVELISTGGTAKKIREAGIPVKDVSEITGFPEMMDGRVKTLHPLIHAGILNRSDLEEDQKALAEIHAEPIDLIVVNLYPFLEVTAGKSVVIPGLLSANSHPDKTTLELSEAIEVIDIGGPSMIRAAAKNMMYKAVLSSPQQYESFVNEIQNNGAISFKTRVRLAQEAFEHTAEYDQAIQLSLQEALVNLDLSEQETTIDEAVTKKTLILRESQNLQSKQAHWLRYGENPHQLAAVIGNPELYIDCFHGKELSYNNYLDLDAALRLMADFKNDEPTTAIFKHTVPCLSLIHI